MFGGATGILGGGAFAPLRPPLGLNPGVSSLESSNKNQFNQPGLPLMVELSAAIEFQHHVENFKVSCSWAQLSNVQPN